MQYKFSTKVFGQEGIYGVEYDSIPNNERALFEINSYIWTSEEVQNILEEVDLIKPGNDFQYSIEGGNLLIVADKEETHLFNLLNREQRKADIIWSTEKFIKFLKEFKEFLKKNGR